MKFYLYLLKIVDNVLLFLLLSYYQEGTLFLVVFAMGQAFSIMIQTGMFVLYGGFANRISDLDVGGTYLTFLNSIHNLGNMMTVRLPIIWLQNLITRHWCFLVGGSQLFII